jgi:hypothetical protein
VRTLTFAIAVAFALLLPSLAQSVEKADLVVVEKSTSRLHLMKNGEVFATFPVSSCRILRDDEVPASPQRPIAGGDACATRLFAML